MDSYRKCWFESGRCKNLCLGQIRYKNVVFWKSLSKSRQFIFYFSCLGVRNILFSRKSCESRQTIQPNSHHSGLFLGKPQRDMKVVILCTNNNVCLTSVVYRKSPTSSTLPDNGRVQWRRSNRAMSTFLKKRKNRAMMESPSDHYVFNVVIGLKHSLSLQLEWRCPVPWRYTGKVTQIETEFPNLIGYSFARGWGV